MTGGQCGKYNKLWRIVQSSTSAENQSIFIKGERWKYADVQRHLGDLIYTSVEVNMKDQQTFKKEKDLLSFIDGALEYKNKAVV